MTILTDRVNFAKDIKDVRQQWLHDLFLYIGLDTEGMQDVPKDLIVEYLVESNIEVIEHVSIDGLEVRHEGEVIGEWGGPSFVLKEDKGGNLYFEATIEYWSVIEDEIDMEEPG
jgi:hypothetical protein